VETAKKDALNYFGYDHQIIKKLRDGFAISYSKFLVKKSSLENKIAKLSKKTETEDCSKQPALTPPLSRCETKNKANNRYNFYSQGTATFHSNLDCWELKFAGSFDTFNTEPIRKAIVLNNYQNMLATASTDNTIMIYDMEDGTLLNTLEGHRSWVINLIELSDGRLASCSYDKTIRIWKLPSGICQMVLRGKADVWCVMELPQNILLSGSADGVIRCWNLKFKPNRFLKTINTASKGIVTDIILLDNDYLACGSGHNVDIIRYEDGYNVKTLYGHKDYVRSLIHLERKRQLLSASGDYTIRLWSLETYQTLKIFKGHTSIIWKIVMFNEVVIASASSDCTIMFWDLEDGCCIGTLEDEEDVTSLVVLQDGTLISAGNEDCIKFWSV
jgi:WD40 repeat protein